ncbi:MAG: NADPH-dependent glutamate synthase [Abditibacteriota bacterium]|nr:NADPH-dependent glutamate synthase [Abditibacteriota bacterium]
MAKGGPRNPMPHQDPKVRATNFEEVAMGYTEAMALDEAQRCLGCKAHPCVKGCPVNVHIPDFIAKIKDGDYIGASEEIKLTNALPSVCGRVCPQENQCEKHCILGIKGEPVAIGRLERFVADYQAANEKEKPEFKPLDASLAKYNVAVVGTGPSGLTVAADLAKLGYSVTMFEALHKIGGVLRYGIPEFRLPRTVLDAEIDYVKSLGVTILPNIIVGRTFKVKDLLEQGYDAVFVGSGAGAPKMMKIPGEGAAGIYSGNEWLTRINLMRAYSDDYDTPIRKPKKVCVIGAGNTAMDCTRTALRVGAESVTIVYRRGREEMPARAEEIENAEEEGVVFKLLTNPKRFIADEDGAVCAMECLKMELGEPDDSGRRRPVPVEGSEFNIECDTVIVALGQNPNPLIRTTTEGLECQSWGGIIIDEETGMTNIPGLFAGGDAVTGEATVILAMGAGKVAAKGIDNYIKSKYNL